MRLRITLTTLAALVLVAGCGQGTGSESDSSVIGGPQHHRAPARTAAKAAGCRVHGSLPDAACTPGAAGSATVSQVCVSGYSALVRNVPPAVKASVFRAYGITSHAAGSYEIDHLVPLELGGSNARANLWPERAPGYGRKDMLENAYHAAVCNGTLSLPVAQHRMARNWLRYAPHAPKPAPPKPAPKPAPTPRPAPNPPSSSSPSPGGHVTCSTFSSHAQAQSYFQAHQDTAGNLDRDGDGQACESLP